MQDDFCEWHPLKPTMGHNPMSSYDQHQVADLIQQVFDWSL